MRGDVSHPGADDLEDGSGLAADQVQLVHDEEIHALDVLALLPSPRQHVPTLGSGDDHVAW